ncbi:MAG: PilZ domain-containing protein [Holophagaceae bacterium]|nr:PilZ domain-containing protein [Holophagaceae bacterium]
MSHELRTFRRIPMEAEVVFQELTFEAETQVLKSKYKNVSGGGLLLNSSQQYQLGALLKLEIRVPGIGKYVRSFEPKHIADNKPLLAIGEVVRIEIMDDGEYELGIKFLNVYPDDLNALIMLINSSDQNQSS